MLDNETRRRIDTARDVLVGKVPDPKSQVEQITIALVYKFMDDMDRQSVAMGGNPSFFVGEFEKYAWSRIFDPRLGGFEMLALYSDAITRLSQNPHLPQLFRDIFKNAFLPYRDPETLRLFLKAINEFVYDHSERLGDAFEYLLSILGSQGQAGQFLTPRHIIKFIVDVVKPQKNETVLDPACGTAGFLIAAYNHILQENTKSTPGDCLLPEERNRLMDNFTGYDISPDMVRLSLVNLYLHGFPQPQVFEYDTLTSEDRWNEYADVILANPPFMSPKGGIRPHRRFSVQSTRSEVLFVDYMAEHLTPNGRAGIIVPEGIIFQSGNAYKQLRRYLVEQEYLWAVVSLPSGVFNPYAGVKTSILFLDRELAKRTDRILFVKVENDGLDLGAQRRPIDKNDLPAAVEALKAWRVAVDEGKTADENFLKSLESSNLSILSVPKTRLAEDGEYNFSNDRYRDGNKSTKLKYPMVELGTVCVFEYGKPLKSENRVNGEYPVYGSNGVVGFHNDFLVQAPFIVVGRKGSAGEVHYSEIHGFPIDTTFFIKLKDERNILLKYLFHILKTLGLSKINTQSGVPGLNRNDAYKQQIPLPPLEFQQQIVDEIDGYQKVIDGARQVVDNWKPNLEFELEEARKAAGVEKWPTVRLGEICEINPKKSEIRHLPDDTLVTFLPMADLNKDNIHFEPKQTKKISEVYKGYTYFKNKDVLLARVTPCFENGKSGIAVNLSSGIGFGSSEYIVIRPSDNILPEYIYYLISRPSFIAGGINRMVGTGGLQRVPAEYVSTLLISLPPISVQKDILSQFEDERQLVEANRHLITAYEDKIRRVIQRVWEG